MNDMACENCGNNCGGMLASSPKECGSWRRKPTKSERAKMNGCEPVSYIPMGDVTERGTHLWSQSFGITKREHFAAMAMQGMLSASLHLHDYPSQASALAIEHADALLCALSHSVGGEA